MKIQFIFLSAYLSLNFILSQTVWADHGGHGHDGPCEHAVRALGGPIQVLGGRQNAALFDENLRNLEKVREVARKLGYPVPPMVVRFQTASELVAQTSGASGGNPAPHSIEGEKIVMSARRASGILEMVTPGKGHANHFARDTNSASDQALVDAHVEGHNMFAVMNPLVASRDLDIQRDSERLADLMGRLYWQADKEEVVKFYQYLASMQYLQDIHRGTFQHPDQFRDQLLDFRPQSFLVPDGMGGFSQETKLSRPQHPTQPTLSVLQAFVHNLPASEPSWKREILELFERVNRFTAAGIQTKIANEGWATISEEIILGHAFKTHDDAFEFGQLNAGVAYPRMSNPYWLGREAWRRIHDRFFEKSKRENPKFNSLSPIEQDRLFVDHAADIIRSVPNDYDFLLYGLDETWVKTHNLFLYRTHDDPEYNIGITRDPQRIIQYIAKKFADKASLIPAIELVDFNHAGTAAMVLRHRNYLNIPLSQPGMVKSLFVLSQIQKRPITLETFASALWSREMAQPTLEDLGIDPQSASQYSQVEFRRLVEDYKQKQAQKIYPMRVTVSPNGKVAVEFINGAPSFRTAEQHQKILEKYLASYRADLQISYSPARAEARGEKIISAMLDLGAIANGHIVEYMGHSPTAAHAVNEYYDMAGRRVATYLDEIIAGKRDISFTKDHSSVVLQGLPEVPHFEYDSRAANKRNHFLPRTSPDPRWGDEPVDFGRGGFFLDTNNSKKLNLAQTESVAYPDEDLDLNAGPILPGDVWKKPKKQEGKGGDQGEGEGEDESEGDSGDSSEGEDGQGHGDKPGGNGGPDSGSVRIPIEVLGERLAEKLQLRNLRRTGNGSITMEEEIRVGSAQRPSGYLREDLMAEKDYANGVAIAKAQKLDLKKMRFIDFLTLGAKHRQSSDNVVADQNPEPVPLSDAVIIFVRDGSGSMSEEHIKLVDEISARIEAVMKHFYKKVNQRYVMYNQEAEEVNRQDFFSKVIGGGTNAEPAVELTNKILETDYPRSKYNRYVFHFSDGDDSNNDLVSNKIRALLNRIEFFGYGHIDPQGGGVRGLSSAIQELLKSQDKVDKVGFADLRNTPDSLLQALREYFGPKKKPN